MANIVHRVQKNMLQRQYKIYLVHLEDLGHKLGLIIGEKSSKSFVFQSIGISIQKGNAACILGTKGVHGKLEELSYTANAYRQTTDKLMFKSVISTIR